MFLLVTIFNIVAILTGLFCLRKGGPVFLYLVLILISPAFINENFIVPNSKRWWHIHPNAFYNIYSLAEICAWFVIYYRVFHKKTRPFLLLCGIALIIYTLSELFITASFKDFHSNSYFMFSACSLILSLLYIFTITLYDRHALTQDPAFFLCSALVCFHSVFFLNLLTMLDPGYWKQRDATSIFDLLQSLATCTYYLFICIAFIIFSCKSSHPADHRILY